MAGDGVRFKDKGYLKAKPLINVGKSLMFIEAAKSFGLNQNWLFITRLNKSKKEIIKSKMRIILYLFTVSKYLKNILFKLLKLSCIIYNLK